MTITGEASRRSNHPRNDKIHEGKTKIVSWRAAAKLPRRAHSALGLDPKQILPDSAPAGIKTSCFTTLFINHAMAPLCPLFFSLHHHHHHQHQVPAACLSLSTSLTHLHRSLSAVRDQLPFVSPNSHSFQKLASVSFILARSYTSLEDLRLHCIISQDVFLLNCLYAGHGRLACLCSE
jgi:hypothetical protein